MMVAPKSIALLVLLAVITLQVESGFKLASIVCSNKEKSASPCLCCKKSCWYDTSVAINKYFGNMPGVRGDSETMFSFSAMGQCMKEKCHGICPTK